MSNVGKRVDRLEVVGQRGSAPDADAVRRIAAEVAAEFGVPVEAVMVEAEAIVARGPRTVEQIADEVASEPGLPVEVVRRGAYVIWEEARRVRR